MQSVDDAELISRILAGEGEQYGILIGRYQSALYRHALGMVLQPDAAADLVQETFIKAYTSLNLCQDPARFRAWIFRILSNRCRDHLKNLRQRTVPLEGDTALTSIRDDPEHGVEQRELREAVNHALSCLPEAQREAFLLKHVEGRSYEEMAELLEVSVSALKMRVSRARETLQALLGGVAC